MALTDEAQDLLFREARTANAFTNEPVSAAEIEAVYELTKYGPTAANTQPLRITLLQSDAAKARLLPHMSDGNRAKTAAAPLTAVLAADTDFHEHLPRVFPHKPGMKDTLTDPTGRTSMATFNAGLQIGYFIVGVRAAGLAVGPMAGFDKEGVDREFFADRSWKSLVVANIGHPAEDAWFDRLPRLAYDEAVEVL